MAEQTTHPRSVAAALLILLLKGIFWILVVCLPVLGAWIGSSLAAYLNGPTWVPIAAALLAFPLLPLAWDGLGSWRFARKQRKRQRKADKVAKVTGKRFDDQPGRILTFSDRLIVRTMVVNLVFLGVLLGLYPETVFTALSTRGDWFLDRSKASWAPGARDELFAAADRLEWLWDLTHDNPFADDTPTPTPEPQPTPEPTAAGTASRSASAAADGADDGKPPAPDGNDEPAPRRRWPFEPKLHPAVAEMPSSEETSVSSVGAYLSSQESDPYLLVKALHDYAADRISYDVPSYHAGTIPRQDAESIFAARTGVCAGYAKLLVALGKAAGAEIVYVVGQSRDMGGNVDGQGHAWNAARIEGDWYLIDATWDAGYVNGDTFTKKYTSDYLLTPPKVFGLNHYPDKPDWQLRSEPIGRGEFMRQPNVRPMLYAKGFELLTPQRSQITVGGNDFAMELENRDSRFLLISWVRKGSGSDGQSCQVQHGRVTRAVCALPGHGTYHVFVSVGEQQFGTYWRAGQFEVNRR